MTIRSYASKLPFPHNFRKYFYTKTNELTKEHPRPKMVMDKLEFEVYLLLLGF